MMWALRGHSASLNLFTLLWEGGWVCGACRAVGILTMRPHERRLGMEQTLGWREAPGTEEVAGVRCPLPWNLGSMAVRGRHLSHLLPPGPGEANGHCLPHERGRPAWWQRQKQP